MAVTQSFYRHSSIPSRHSIVIWRITFIAPILSRNQNFYPKPPRKTPQGLFQKSKCTLWLFRSFFTSFLVVQLTFINTLYYYSITMILFIHFKLTHNYENY